MGRRGWTGGRSFLIYSPKETLHEKLCRRTSMDQTRGRAECSSPIQPLRSVSKCGGISPNSWVRQPILLDWWRLAQCTSVTRAFPRRNYSARKKATRRVRKTIGFGRCSRSGAWVGSQNASDGICVPGSHTSYKVFVTTLFWRGASGRQQALLYDSYGTRQPSPPWRSQVTI